MSRENVQRFLDGVEAINRRDVEAGIAVAHPDVVFITLRSAVEGEYRGHDGLRRFWANNDENFDTFRMDIRDVRDLGDRVLGIGTIRIRGKRSGIETDVPTAGVATFRDGKLCRWEDFGDARRALDAVGLRE